MIPELSTERLTLRGPTLADADAYAAFYAVSDAPVGKYRARSRDEALEILKGDMADWNAKGFGMWVLRRRADGVVVGGAGLVHPDDWPRRELTWWLHPDHRGHGYATEASRAAVAFGYDTLGWNPVETHMRDENLPARRIAERLGGRIILRDVFPDGVARDVFALPHPGRPEGRAA